MVAKTSFSKSFSVDKIKVEITCVWYWIFQKIILYIWNRHNFWETADRKVHTQWTPKKIYQYKEHWDFVVNKSRFFGKLNYIGWYFGVYTKVLKWKKVLNNFYRPNKNCVIRNDHPLKKAWRFRNKTRLNVIDRVCIQTKDNTDFENIYHSIFYLK